jgi:hypothetical protein
MTMHSEAKDVKFGIFATVQIPLRWGIGNSAKPSPFIHASIDLLDVTLA